MTTAPEPSPELIEAFTEITGRLDAREGATETMRRIADEATRVIEGCDAASITLVEDGVPRTVGATSQLAEDGDLIQYDAGEGPCLDAAMTERWILTRDLAESPRWPKSAQRMSEELGVRSMLSGRLVVDSAPLDTLGGLNLYSLELDAYTSDDVVLAAMLCALGATVIAGARQQENLRVALESRQMIGEAVGILRAQSNVSSEEAFTMLTAASQRMNVKLRDIAAQIGRQVGDGVDPVEDPPG